MKAPLVSMIHSGLAGGALLLLLAGCVGYQVKPISAGNAAAAFEDRSLTSPGLKKFIETNLGRRVSWPPKWNLAMLTQAALFHHPDLDVARAQLATARAAVSTAGERPNPTVTWSPQFPTPIQPLIAGTYGVDFDIPIETAGKRGKRLAQARKQWEAARCNVSTVSWQVRARLRKALLDLFAASERENLLTHDQQTQMEISGLMEQQVSSGEISRPQLTQSRLLLNQTRLMLAEAHKLSVEARVNVADALGVSVRALDGVKLSLDEFRRLASPQSYAKLRRRALLSRSDILGSLADYAAAEAALRLEVAKQFPDIHLTPGYAFDGGVNKWNIGFSIPIPILNQNRGPIAEAEGRRAEAAAKFIALQARVIADLDRAIAGYRAAYEKLGMADTLLASQQKQTESAQSLFKAGESDRLALSSAELERDSSAISRLDALVEAQQSFGQLEDAAQISGDMQHD